MKTAAELANSLFGMTSYSNAPQIVDKRGKKKKGKISDSRTPTPEQPVAEEKPKWGNRSATPEVEQVQFVMPEMYRKKEETAKKPKKRTKYRNIDESQEAMMIPGRNKCDCQETGYIIRNIMGDNLKQFRLRLFLV